MSEPQESKNENKNKKYLLIGLFSVAILGTGIAFASFYPNKNGTKEPTQTTVSSAATDKEESTLGKYFKETEKKEEKEKKREAKKNGKTKDTLREFFELNEASGREYDPITGTVESPKKEKKLVEQLAIALDQHEQQQIAREKSATVQAAEKEESKSNEKLPTPDNPNNPIKPIDNHDVPDRPKPIIPDDPKPTPVEPVNPVDPKPTPVDPVEPSIEQLVAQSKAKLTNAQGKAERLNEQLTEVKTRLEALNTIETNTEQGQKEANAQWSEVKKLIEEYNTLSIKIKQLITDEGVVLPIDQEIYQDTYNQIQEKVSEIKQAQQKANQKTASLDNSVTQAATTATNLSQITETYQNSQKIAANNISSETQQAVSAAQANPAVAEKVSLEINNATQENNALQQTNQAVEQQVQQANDGATQAAVEQAKSVVEEVKTEASTQNPAVTQVENEFNALPKPVEQVTPVSQTNENGQESTPSQVAEQTNGLEETANGAPNT